MRRLVEGGGPLDDSDFGIGRAIAPLPPPRPATWGSLLLSCLSRSQTASLFCTAIACDPDEPRVRRLGLGDILQQSPIN